MWKKKEKKQRYKYTYTKKAQEVSNSYNVLLKFWNIYDVKGECTH